MVQSMVRKKLGKPYFGVSLASVLSFGLFLSMVVGSGLSPQAAVLAQDAPRAPGRTRLARPGSSAVLPSGQQVFNLGVEHKQQVESESDTEPFKGPRGLQGFAQEDPFDGRRGTPTSEPIGSKFPEVNVGLSNRERDVPVLPIAPFSLQLLAKYDLELIVDHSMSMHNRDCPGDTSRWEWCGMQAHDLAQKISPFVPSGLTLTSFARDYEVHKHASPQNIADLFENSGFSIGTRMAEPLSDRLENYFAERKPGSKPMLIAVITDGVPTPKKIEPQMVADAIINASGRVRGPHEVTIVFFQIGGGDYKGRAFLDYLDNNLVSQGARYDIVRTVSFDHLEQVGLAQALVDSVKEFAKQSVADKAPAAPLRTARKLRP